MKSKPAFFIDGTGGASRRTDVTSLSAPWGYGHLRHRARECARCHDMTQRIEKHHIVYLRCLPKTMLCVPCHGEITIINTLFMRLKKRKLRHDERWYLWIAFLSIDKNWFYAASPPEQQRWITWLAEHYTNLTSQLRGSAPRGQFTDDAKAAGSVVTANDPHLSDGEQAALLGAGQLVGLTGGNDCPA